MTSKYDIGQRKSQKRLEKYFQLNKIKIIICDAANHLLKSKFIALKLLHLKRLKISNPWSKLLWQAARIKKSKLKPQQAEGRK